MTMIIRRVGWFTPTEFTHNRFRRNGLSFPLKRKDNSSYIISIVKVQLSIKMSMRLSDALPRVGGKSYPTELYVIIEWRHRRFLESFFRFFFKILK